MSALYWLCKEEEAHSELNSLLEPVESLQDVAPFKKRSSRKRTVINTGQSEKENLLKQIKNLHCLLTDIANIQNLVTFTKFYDDAFIDLTDLLHFSETNAAIAKTIHDCLTNVFPRLGLELNNLTSIYAKTVFKMRDLATLLLNKHKK